MNTLGIEKKFLFLYMSKGEARDAYHKVASAWPDEFHWESAKRLVFITNEHHLYRFTNCSAEQLLHALEPHYIYGWRSVSPKLWLHLAALSSCNKQSIEIRQASKVYMDGLRDMDINGERVVVV